MTSLRLAFLMLLSGTLLPFLVGIAVGAVLHAAGKPVLPSSLILGSFHIWVPMAVALGLSSLPSRVLLVLSCPDGEVTSAGVGMFLGFVATLIVAFAASWMDANQLIEGFALAPPLFVLVFAFVLAVGAGMGGALGFATERILRARSRDGQER